MIPKEEIGSIIHIDEHLGCKSNDGIAQFGIVDNTPLKRAKEMYSS